MKNIILSAIAMAFVLVSCNQKNKQEETVNSETNQKPSKSRICKSQSKFFFH